MRYAPHAITLTASLLLATGCVRRTITDRPGYRDPATGKLLYITPNYEKTDEDRIVWFWEPEFHKTRKAFKQDEEDDQYGE